MATSEHSKAQLYSLATKATHNHTCKKNDEMQMHPHATKTYEPKTYEPPHFIA